MSVLSNGYLLALTAVLDVEFDAEFLVIAGGGDWGARVDNAAGGGGGAGGYISSVSGENSGGGASAISAAELITGVAYSVTVGAAGSNTIFSGTDRNSTAFNNTAIAGGAKGQTGGSGGGAAVAESATGGSGTTGQGFAGSNVYFQNGNTYCKNTAFYCNENCYFSHGGAGGGAGGAASNKNGGVGVQSSITGTATYYAGGGASETVCATSQFSQGTAGNGASNYGGGGSYAQTGQPGVVILRYSTDVTISNPGGGLTMSTAVVGSNNVTTITAGTGNIEFAA